MRAFVTGGTGFIGRCLVRKLRERGDEVAALVRSPDRASPLVCLGCRLVEGDLGNRGLLRRAMEDCDAVFHTAAIYEVGVAKSRRPAMYEANVRGTEHVLDAAIDARVSRIVHVSTINVYGNTRGRVVDEGYRRPPGGYLSYYDETKFLANQIALERIAQGAPISIAQPGQVYGPGDHSEVGSLIERMRRGRLPFLAFPDVGFNFVHLDDAAQGILLVHDRGEIGESYVLGGELTTMGKVVEKVALLSGRRPPRFAVPTTLIRLAVPVAPLVGKLMRLPPNLAEVIRAAEGVTYWATDAKARKDLRYSPRDAETGLRQLLGVT